MSDSSNVIRNPWQALRGFTQARIALGRAGVSVPTTAQLAFQLAHARARDAVHHPLDASALAQSVQAAGMHAICVHSACPERATYLQRPDLGRRLGAGAHAALQIGGSFDLALVIADGLSALAIEQNALPFLDALLPLLAPDGWALAPVVIASEARVAIGDEIGAALNARAVVVLIGERPGLSSPDSMGLYLTWNPRPGLTDAQRNCISNVRPAGLSYAQAAHKLHYLLSQARTRGLSGIDLKDDTSFDAGRAVDQARNFLLG